ncbi:amidohydrolase [Paramesorhizobium deserti]|uniref:Amidohydrolase n=1 Tax=Paramesorhizobium deserti TaxID=1494590 RepID=A0A135HY69_9HYPH|nr:amidohydrolase family protein [Paramesorhizobium deserti]KXF78135.1 amidohydrolase [Paramesorhizobium deserti]
MMREPTSPVTGVDTHAHIFTRALPMEAGRRYTPGYDALVTDYLAHLDAHGLSHGVLIQPSFLGTDNSFIKEAIAAHPDRLRGVAVVARDVSDCELDSLVTSGFAGIRLNLVGKELEDYGEPEWQAFFAKLASRGLQVEIQRRFEDFPAFVPAILASGVTIVIDHFGLPVGGVDPEKPEHAAFLELLPAKELWVKLSATYRSAMTRSQAKTSLALLRQAAGGIDRMIWGSDWPHTQYEENTDYDAQFSMTGTLFPAAEERRQVLVGNAAWLFGIA